MHANSPQTHFMLPPQPEPGDPREYNAFGYLKGFGKAYAEYYAKLDREAADKAAKG